MMLGWKRMLALLLALCLMPLWAMGEEDLQTPDSEDAAEMDTYDEVGLDEDETAGGLLISDEVMEGLGEIEMEVDDSIDRDSLDLNTNLPDNVINILLVGIDTRSTELSGDGQHGDVQIILSINKDNGSVKLTSIQRDLYVAIPGYKKGNRINVAYQYGQGNPKLNGSGGQLAMRTINRNFEMNIEYYATINFFGLASIIDALGGVDMELTREEAVAINAYLKRNPPKYDNQGKDYKRQDLEKTDGVHHLDGVQAVMYARTRSVDNDFGRTERQRKLLEVLLSNVMKDMDVSRLLELIQLTVPYVSTNMNLDEMFQLAVGLLQSGIIERAQNGETLMDQHRIPMDGTFKYTQIDGNSVIDFMYGKKQENIEALHEFIYGQYYPAK